MIDWISLGFSALWIFGLGLELAALSFASYLSGQQKWRFRRTLALPACRMMIGLGLVFFCLGCAGGGSVVWERILWAVLALLFAVQTWQARKKSSA